jgi:hypothetical protein
LFLLLLGSSRRVFSSLQHFPPQPNEDDHVTSHDEDQRNVEGKQRGKDNGPGTSLIQLLLNAKQRVLMLFVAQNHFI